MGSKCFVRAESGDVEVEHTREVDLTAGVLGGATCSEDGEEELLGEELRVFELTGCEELGGASGDLGGAS